MIVVLIPFFCQILFDHKEEYKRYIPYEKAFWSKERIGVTEEDADYFLSLYKKI